MQFDKEQIINNCKLNASPPAPNPIAALNDQLRKNHIGGRIMMTQGVSAMGPEAARDILAAIAGFDVFTPANDPYGEHDCAVMEIDGIGGCGRSTITTRHFRHIRPTRPIPM